MSRNFLAPDNLQNKTLSRCLTVKKGYIQVVQTSDYIEGQWELTSKLPREARVEGDVRFVGNFPRLKMSVFVTQRFSSRPCHPEETLRITYNVSLLDSVT